MQLRQRREVGVGARVGQERDPTVGQEPGRAREPGARREPLRPPAQRDATTANPQGVPFAISDDAAQRAFPSELLVAHAVGVSAARQYVDWAAIAPMDGPVRAPQRPKSTTTLPFASSRFSR